MTLHPITPAVTHVFKQVLLRALRDSPSAFGSTYAREVQFTDDEWQQRATWSISDNVIGELAIDQQQAQGIVAGLIDSENPATAHLVSMWVAPEYRKTGVSTRLVTAIADWATSKQIQALRLMVTSNNEVAIQFYQRLGFVKTGRTKAYPNDPALVEYEMVHQLTPQ
ncbi:MAG: GNAT family N-acetyltransferase [Cyanobacteria bacterium P01_C01_bin.70]